MVTDIHLYEANGWASSTDNCGDGQYNLVSPDLMTLLGITHTRNGVVSGGAMASKVSHSVIQFIYRTPLGVTSLSMANVFSFDAIFLH